MRQSQDYIRFAQEHAESTMRDLDSLQRPLDAGETLNYLHACLSLIEPLRERFAAGDGEAGERVETVLRKALRHAEICPEPDSDFSRTDLDFVRTAICLYLREHKKALRYCKACLKSAQSLEEGSFKQSFLEQIRSALRVCEEHVKAIEHPSFMRKSAPQRDSYIFAVLRSRDEHMLQKPNELYRALHESDEFEILEFQDAGITGRNAGSFNYFEHLCRCERLSLHDSAVRNIDRRDGRLEEDGGSEAGAGADAGSNAGSGAEDSENAAAKSDAARPSEDEAFRRRFELNIDALAGQLDFLTRDPKQSSSDDAARDGSPAPMGSAAGASFTADGSDPASGSGGFSSLDFARYRMELPKTIAEQFTSVSPEKQAHTPVMHVRYLDEIYRVRLFACPIASLISRRRLRFPLRDADADALQKASRGIAVVIESGNNPFRTFRLQLKMLLCLVKDPLALLDESSQQIYPPDQAAYLTQGDLEIPANQLYSVQATVKEDHVWLRTRGLSRFLPGELEILHCPVKLFKTYGDILHTLCAVYLENPEEAAPYAPLLTAQLSNDRPVVCTLVPWPDALIYMRDVAGVNFAGCLEDRSEENRSESYCVYVYDTLSNYKSHIFKSLDVFAKALADGPALLLPAAESERQRRLAQYGFRELLLSPKALQHRVLTVKAALRPDDGNDGAFEDLPENLQEFCWFTVVSFNSAENFTAVLNSEPYYIQGIHAGEALELEVGDICWWKVLDVSSGGVLYTPVSAFMARR